jgi:pyruvate kinase
LAAFRLPVWTIPLTQSAKTFQDLLFSSGVMPLHLPEAPESWVDFVKDWVRRHQLPGAFAILTQPPSVKGAQGAHRMEIIDL